LYVCQPDPFAEPFADPTKFLQRDGEHEKVQTGGKSRIKKLKALL
jgi:hypothetical protein